ncbi:MAG: EAL domain-containing protein [Sphingomonadales bacterium]|nr:EAL domain-containing protein [Sphingomonadales bacterium]MDE2569373.1 EAL domain-containing protein [Sphingomonadales bacterium]
MAEEGLQPRTDLNGSLVSAPAEVSDYARTRRRESISPASSKNSHGIQPLSGTLPSHEWPQIAIAMAMGLALLALIERSVPPLLTSGLIATAVAIVAFTRLLGRFDRGFETSTALRMALVHAVMALPLFMFGAGISLWANAGGIGWQAAMAALVTISLLATVFASGRLIGILAANVSIWVGADFVASPTGGVVSLIVGLAIGALSYYRQRHIDAIQRDLVEENLRVQTRAQEILSEFEETGQGWFWETDRRGQVTYLSRPVAQALGVTVDDLLGKPFASLFNLEQQEEGQRTLTFHLSARSEFSELAVRAASDGEVRWWSITGRPIYDSFNNFIGFRGSGADLTEKRKSQEHAARLAQFDSLTGLSNRLRMSQTLEKILNAPQLHHRACSVFLLDLDRFKQVNDTLGHPAGDALLKQVSQRLERVVDSAGRVGRLGGDEFQVILPGKIERAALGQLAQRIIETLSQPYSIEGSRVTIGASVGVALAPDDGVTSEALIRNADLALYAAKDGGRGRYHFYAPDLHSDAEDRRKLEDDLRDAVANGHLQLYYQPVVQTATEKITGFEALLRWNHPEHGFISPERFIPVAEDTGLIMQIGEWALRTACADLATWPENVRVAVNVSPIQFCNPALPTVVTNALAQAQVDPERLELEITESVFLNDAENIDAMFRSLKALGVRLALDDFGTGYSALGYLKKAPFNKIKIDQSFVRGATQPGSRNGAIIASIVSLAEALDMDTTAEGVETFDELDLVRMLGCSHIQGYIYEKALSPEDALERLRMGLTAIAQGPRSARAARQSMLRKVVLEHGGQHYDGMVRNISQTGALIEGLWNVPSDTIFRVQLADGFTVTATARWSKDDRMGVEFSAPLRLDENGRIAAVVSNPAKQAAMTRPVTQRKVG